MKVENTLRPTLNLVAHEISSKVVPRDVPPQLDRLMGLPEVVRVTTFSRLSVYIKVCEGKLPAPLKLGGTTRIAWRSSEIAAWIAKQPRTLRQDQEVRALDITPRELRDEYSPDRLMNQREVARMTSLSRSSIHYMVRRGTMPAPLKLGHSNRVAWRSSEIATWIANQPRAALNMKIRRYG